MSTPNTGALTGTDRFTMSVRALKSAQRVSAAEICRTLHVSKATYYYRMNGTAAWSLDEAIALAELFQTPLATMVHGIGARQDRRATDRYEDQPTLPKVATKVATSNLKPDKSPRRNGHLTVVPRS